MKKNIFKKMLSAVVVASVVFTTPANAVFVYADEAQGTISFDAGFFTRYTGKNIAEIKGPQGKVITEVEPYKNTSKFKVSDKSKEDNGTARLNAPYMNDENIFNHTGPWNGEAFDFPGYKIKGWYLSEEDKALGNATRILPTRFPVNNLKYSAIFESDNTKYKYKINYSKNGGKDLIKEVLPAEETGEKQTLESVLIYPKNVPGYMIDGLPELKFYEPGGTYNTSVNVPSSANNYDFDISAKKVSGKMVNKDFILNYNYKVDPEKKFKFIIVNHIQDAAGNDKNPKDIRYDLTHSFSAEEDITGIAPNNDFITASHGDNVARFELIKTGDKAPKITSTNRGSNGETTEPKTVKDDYIIGNEKQILKLNPTTFAVEGNMINQNVEVHYYYKPNPSFMNTVVVRYEDEKGSDITDDVIKALQKKSITVRDVYDETHSNDLYKVDGGIAFKVKPSKDYDIQAPEIAPLFKNDNNAVSASITDGSAEFAGDAGSSITGTGWTKDSGKFSLTMGERSASIEVTVSYTHNPVYIKSLILDVEGGGKLTVGDTEYDIVEHPEQAIILEKKQDGHIEVAEDKMPTPKASPGYKFDAWYYRPLSGDDVKVTTWPYSTPASNGDRNTEVFIAKFVKDEDKWLKFNFDVASDDYSQQQLMLEGKNTVELLSVDEVTGQPKPESEITLAKLKEVDNFPTVAIKNDDMYDCVWVDENGNKIEDATQIGNLAGKTIFAKAEPTGNIALGDPVGDFSIDDETGLPTIKITNLNPSTAVKYAVFDYDHEYTTTYSAYKVVKIITGIDMHNANGVIADARMKIGHKYGVIEVAPRINLREGEDIGAEGTQNISTNPLIKQFPACATPIVTEDSKNLGKAKITVTPVTPNTEYALVDEDGNVVKEFTRPENGKVDFDDLLTDKTYKVVARNVEDTNKTPSDVLDTAVEVTTSNFGITATKFDVQLILPKDVKAEKIKVANEEKDVNDTEALKQIPKKSLVSIIVPSQDNNGKFFDHWHIISGNVPISNLKANKMEFTMPSQYVKLQGIYSDGSVEIADTDKDIFDNSDVDVTVPQDLSNGKYRMHIQKVAANDVVASLINNDSSDDYKALWIARAVLQKWNKTANKWEDVDNDVVHTATFKTGKVTSTNIYEVYKLNANEIPTSTPTDASVQSDGVDYTPVFGNDNYPGSFDMKMDNNKYYIFGYSAPKVYVITVKDSRDNSLLTKINLKAGERLGDKSEKYEEFINKAKEGFEKVPNTDKFISREGLTYTYEGLSSDRREYVEVDTFNSPTENQTVYLFYSNDKPERDEAKSDLNALINDIEYRIDHHIPDTKKTDYVHAINVAKEKAGKTDPRKPTTEEIRQITEELRNTISELDNNGTAPTPGGGSSGGDSDGSGGSSGGHSGGSSSSSGGSTGGSNAHYNPSFINKRDYYVGTDGNWKLIDPLNHKWIFETASGRVKGFANLLYTFNGVTKNERYHFDNNGIMDSGWYCDNNDWYYLSEVHDGFFGKMITGWHYDLQDNKWYYLSPTTGKMLLGWQKINDVWYYFTPSNEEATWSYDTRTNKWYYDEKKNIKPLGSLWYNAFSPDGYYINNDGAWDGVLR